jgi:hypothetical protein
MPLVASIYAIINGTGTLAGEEEDGRLEMVVTLPLPRWQIVTAKAVALTISSAIMFLVVAVVSVFVFQSIESQIETDLAAMDLFNAVLSAYPLVFAVGMIGMFLAAFSPSRRFAGTISAIILVVSYFGNNLANSTTALEPFEPFFLFTYLDGSSQAVMEGQQAGDLLVLIIIGLVAFALACSSSNGGFEILTVGAWPWQTGKARTLKQIGQEQGVINAINGSVSGYEVETWESSFPELKQTLDMKTGVMGYMGVFILSIAAIGILNLLMMAVFERTREIGIVGALGLKPREITTLFLLEGTLIGVMGAVIGAVLGTTINGIFSVVGMDYSQFASLTEYTALISGSIYTQLVPLKVLQHAITVVIIATLAAVIPAIQASQREPAEALHYV